MALVLGKRKRRAELNDENPTLQEGSDAASIAPVHQTQIGGDLTGNSENEEEGDDDWSGISEEDEADAVEVVDISSTIISKPLSSKEERKIFMSAKPPSSLQTSKAARKKPPEQDEDPSTEASLLKNDLALQRLLRESHLLGSSSSDSLDVSGKARHKALDLRLQALGSKKSHLAQKNMPMSHRKGIDIKKRTKEEFRRTEAKENGIILEKESRDKGKRMVRRERGIGAPAVGKFSGGTLKLSQKDVRDIEGPKERGRGGKGKKRR